MSVRSGASRPRARWALLLLVVGVLAAAITTTRHGPSGSGATSPARTVGDRIAAHASLPPRYSFDQEFAGPAGQGPNFGASQTIWFNDPCWESGCGFPPKPTRFSLANATLDGHGHLVLTASAGATGSCGSIPCQYTSARLTMLHWAFPYRGQPSWSQRYGQFEARIELPAGKGIFPAFWLTGSNLAKVGFPTAGEIDVVDGVGSSTIAQQQVVFGSSSFETPFGGAFALTGGQPLTGWHTYAVTWSPKAIRWSVDGHTTLAMGAQRAAAVWRQCFEHPFSMILDVEVAQGLTPAQAAKELPAHMLVDWIRVSAS
ncbi:MAG: 1,3-beta-glucanase [Acidimicrobiaceae bacterium]|nr:1,3-beta-glucanase [Acidimicrobiaceae bacterium]